MADPERRSRASGSPSRNVVCLEDDSQDYDGQPLSLLTGDQSVRAVLKDLGIIRQSIRKRWPVSEETIERIVARVEMLLESEIPEVAISAAQTMAKMEAENALDERMLESAWPTHSRGRRCTLGR
jgi:hypothetical protein